MLVWVQILLRMDFLQSLWPTDRHLQATLETFLALSGLFIGLAVVILFILVGWFIVWKMFLLRFPIIHEMFYGSNNGKPVKTKSRRSDIGVSSGSRHDDKDENRQREHED